MEQSKDGKVMCKRWLSVYDSGSIKRYTCEHVKANYQTWLTVFKKVNKTDSIKHDKYYESFRKELEEFVNGCDDLAFEPQGSIPKY